MKIEDHEEHLSIGRAALAKNLCVDWISEHSKTILTSFVVLILFSFCLYQITSRTTTGKKSDFLEAEKAFQLWTSQLSDDAQLLQNLEKPLHHHPELEAKYGTAIAQRLLGGIDVKKGEKYAKSALKRAHDLNSSYYTQFSLTTLLISSGKYQEALKQSEGLKNQMEKDDAFWEGRDKFVRSGTILYAYNLLRIAALQRQLDSKEGELAAWEELIRNAGWKGKPSNLKTYDPEAYALLAQNFTQGDLSLIDYIEQRKLALAD